MDMIAAAFIKRLSCRFFPSLRICKKESCIFSSIHLSYRSFFLSTFQDILVVQYDETHVKSKLFVRKPKQRLGPMLDMRICGLPISIWLYKMLITYI